jgi:uncharacterized membrane protein YphA (DoxX/SURF4 family)
MNKLLLTKPVFLSAGIMLVRVITGIFLAYHGWELFSASKMQEYLQWEQFDDRTGYFLVYAGKITELTAGCLLIAGFLTRIACLLTAAVMLYITFMVGNGIIWYSDQHPFLFVLLALLLFCTGAGSVSLDKIIFDNK